MSIVALHDRLLLSLPTNPNLLIAIPSLIPFQVKLRDVQKGCACKRGSKIISLVEELKTTVANLPAEQKQLLKEILGFKDKTLRVYQRVDNKVTNIDF